MSPTVFLDEPIGDRSSIPCTEAKIMGGIVWASPEGDQEETVIPLSNVAGVTGDDVLQEIEALEAPGGQFTELITNVT